MPADHIDFWFTMGSTYSYLSVMRLGEVEQASGIRFNWRPFHLLIILQEMKHVPFADKPAKAAYMWRDIERRAMMYGIPAALPAPYPATQSIVGNLIATVGMRQGWGADFRSRRVSSLVSTGAGNGQRAQCIGKSARRWPGASIGARLGERG
jgi:2-hydroxychromene-2-carboxylate isomerase